MTLIHLFRRLTLHILVSPRRSQLCCNAIHYGRMRPRLYKCMHPYPAIEQQIGEAAHATPRGPKHNKHCAVQMRKGAGDCHTRCFKKQTRIERAIAIPDESKSHCGLGGPLPCPMNHNRNTDWGGPLPYPMKQIRNTDWGLAAHKFQLTQQQQQQYHNKFYDAAPRHVFLHEDQAW